MRVIAALGLATLLSACATPTRYAVSVNSISAPEAEARKSYFVIPGDAKQQADDLQFRQFVGMLEVALTSQGFRRANSFEEANVAILFSYAVDNGKTEQVTTAIPIFGQTGIASAYTTGTVSPWGSYSANTTYTPSYGITGFTSVSKNVTVFTRVAIIGAYEAPPPKAGDPRPLWRTTIVSTGSSPDLRRVMPYMLRAATPYLGKDTGDAKTFMLDEDPPPSR